MAKGLLSIGIKKGDHVGIWATKVPTGLTFLFATAKIGAVLVTVNTAYRSHELEYVMKQSDMKASSNLETASGILTTFRHSTSSSPELKTHEKGATSGVKGSLNSGASYLP